MSLFRKKITAQEVKDILDCHLELIHDPEYLLPTDKEVQRTVANFIKRRGIFKYRNNSHDCDNAAVELLAWVSGKGWPFAYLDIPGHAINCYINDRREVKYIEPQTGEYVDPPKLLKIAFMT